MNEAYLLDDPFRHVGTRDLFRFLADKFESVTNAARENSVFFREQARTAATTAAIGPATDDFNAACREAVTFAQRIAAGRMEVPSNDMLSLAKRAVQQRAARKDEDVQAWAQRLARDVGNATD